MNKHDEQQPTLFDAPALLSAHRRGNPMLAVYGTGPEETYCKDCEHFHWIKYHDGVYLKCDLRNMTHGAKTDHRARWHSCGKFEARSE